MKQLHLQTVSTTHVRTTLLDLKKLLITFTITVISRSGVLGYQPGSGLLLLGGVAFTAQTGSTFSLLLEGDANRRGSGFPARLPASAPGEATLLIKNPPPERSVRAVLLSSLWSGILEICRRHAAEEMRIGENAKKRSKRARNGTKLKRQHPLLTHLFSISSLDLSCTIRISRSFQPCSRKSASAKRPRNRQNTKKWMRGKQRIPPITPRFLAHYLSQLLLRFRAANPNPRTDLQQESRRNASEPARNGPGMGTKGRNAEISLTNCSALPPISPASNP